MEPNDDSATKSQMEKERPTSEGNVVDQLINETINKSIRLQLMK